MISIISSLISTAGVVLFVLGLVSTLVTYWIWRIEALGWKWNMVINGLSFLLSFMSLNVVSALISLIVLVYLWGKKNLFK